MTRTRMLAAAGLTAVALAATACTDDGAGVPDAGSGDQAADTTTPSPAAPASATPTTSRGAHATSSTRPPAGQARRCAPRDLTATLGRTTGEAGQRHTTVVWTNESAAPCTMSGFAGVDLVGPPNRMGSTWSLTRATKPTPTVRLAPRATAHTVITWLPPQESAGWTPREIVVTPPDGRVSTHLRWPGGAVLRQDAATHPGTYVDPVIPGPRS